jgi:tripeptide aminopeptidase
VREIIDRVFADVRIRHAFSMLEQNESRIEADQIRISLVPAPPFAETDRAQVFSSELRQLNFRPVMDAIGNVITPFETPGANPVVIGAHLDTVFPATTPLQVRRRGRAICLPGIADNGAGIVALLWVLRVAREVGLRFQRPLIAIGNVGEEGEGNLRGIRHLFNAPPWEGRECDFIAIDVGSVHRITHEALGSRRFRIRMTGPGGHSWADFGKPNPVHALSSVLHYFTSAGFGRRPGTSFNVGIIRGGISVNAIPSEAYAELDLRSTQPVHIDEMEAHLRRIIAGSVTASGVECKIELMGERPGGQTSVHAPIVQAAQEVTRRFGVDPQLDVGSTDANIPMSMGIPAIALGAGGTSGSVHTTDEWFDPTHRTLGLQRLLALIAALGRLQ